MSPTRADSVFGTATTLIDEAEFVFDDLVVDSKAYRRTMAMAEAVVSKHGGREMAVGIKDLGMDDDGEPVRSTKMPRQTNSLVKVEKPKSPAEDEEQTQPTSASQPATDYSVTLRSQGPSPEKCAEAERKLAHLFELHQATGRQSIGKTFSTHDVQQVANLLQTGGWEYQQCPRIYIVLRAIGALKSLETFAKSGVTDMWFPFPPESLPFGLQPAAAARFRQSQTMVLSRTHDLKETLHCHVSEDDLCAEHGLLPKYLEWLEDLGGGGFGYVYKVRGRKSGGEFAVKQILRDHVFDKAQRAMQSIESERDAMKKLSGHLHFAQLVGSYTSLRYVGLIMAPAAECNLETFLSHVPRLGAEGCGVLQGFFGCLASAIAHLHFGLNIRHKDIKPSNILVKGTNVLLTDFGMARDWGDVGQTTTHEEVRRTPLYCSPEAGHDMPRRSSSDVWSLGCVFLEMATVLKGKTVDEMRTLFEKSGSRDRAYWKNPQAVNLWLDTLRQNPMTPFAKHIIGWTVQMLQRDEQHRPDARTLRSAIFAEPYRKIAARYCRACCTGIEPDSTGSSAGTGGGNISSSDKIWGIVHSSAEQILRSNGFDARGHDLRGTGRRALEWSVTQGQDSVVQLLLENMVDPQQKFGNGDTPLHAAVKAGNTAVAKMLIENGASLETKNDSGWTPLHVAGLSTHYETFELLLEQGADIHARGDAEGSVGFTPLHCVASEGTLEMASLLLEQGADVNAQDTYRIRPLARLADKNYGYSRPYRKRDSWDEALAQLLMCHGADVNATDVWNITALHRVAVQGNTSMIKTLIEGGADIRKRDNDSKTPFGWAGDDHPEAQALLKIS